MNDKRYHVIFSGGLMPGREATTVKANLILDMGLSEEMVERLLKTPGALLKRYKNPVEARRLAEKLERAGLVCHIEDQGAPPSGTAEGGGESSLITLFNRFRAISRRQPAAAGRGR